MIHTVKGFHEVYKAGIVVFWNCLAFSIIQWIWAIWTLVPLSFLNLCISGSSLFMYIWNLAWRVLSITWLHVKWVQLYGSVNILSHCSSLELEWKLTFSSPLASVERGQWQPTRALLPGESHGWRSLVGCSWEFQICWHIQCSTLTSSSFKYLSWNSVTTFRFVSCNLS